MTQLSISAAARYQNVSRSTLNRHIKKGAISVTRNGRHVSIDTSELRRVYGEPKTGADTPGTGPEDASGSMLAQVAVQEAHDGAVDALQRQIRRLEKDLDRSQTAEEDLRGLLRREQENVRLLTHTPSTGGGIFDKIVSGIGKLRTARQSGA